MAGRLVHRVSGRLAGHVHRTLGNARPVSINVDRSSCRHSERLDLRQTHSGSCSGEEVTTLLASGAALARVAAGGPFETAALPAWASIVQYPV